MSVLVFFRKSYVKAHQRRLKSGQVITIPAHYDKRTKKGADAPLAHGHDLRHLDEAKRATFEKMHAEQHLLHHYHAHALRQRVQEQQGHLEGLAKQVADHRAAGRHVEAAKRENQRLRLYSRHRVNQRELDDIEQRLAGLAGMKEALVQGSGAIDASTADSHKAYAAKLGDRFKAKPEADKPSVVTDAAGAPLVVYHGSDRQIDTFADQVTFVTAKQSYADGFGAGGVVMPLHAHITHPANADQWDEARKTTADNNGTIKERQEVARKKLIAQGYDGVVVVPGKTWIAFHGQQLTHVAQSEKAEVQAKPQEYRYALRNRPFGIGTAPKDGWVRTEPRPAEGEDHHGLARHGFAVYSRPLTDKETSSFELTPIVTVDEHAKRLVAKMGRYATKYAEPANAKLLTEYVTQHAGSVGVASTDDMAALQQRVLAQIGGGKAKSFTPTHELPDGTPVRATDEKGVYTDASGAEIEDDYAKPIKTGKQEAPKSEVTPKPVVVVTKPKPQPEPTAKTPPAPKTAATITPPTDSKDLAAHLSALADQEDSAADDWASRKYQGNNQRIELAGDGPLKTPETTVGAANESRRAKAIDQHRGNAAALRRAAKMPAGELVARVREVLDKPIEANRNLSEAKEYDLALAAAVLEMRDGQVGPGSPGRLLREAVEPVIRAQRQAEQAEKDRLSAITPAERAQQEKETEDFWNDFLSDKSDADVKAKHPQEGDTKSENGIDYVLKDGRWHRTTAEAKAPTKPKTKPNPTHYRVNITSPFGEFQVYVAADKDAIPSDYLKDAKTAFLHDSGGGTGFTSSAQVKVVGDPVPVTEVPAEASAAKNAEWARIAKVVKPAASVAPETPTDDLDPSSPNYRYRDTGYVGGSRKVIVFGTSQGRKAA